MPKQLHLQPLLHDQTVVLKAPMQAWSAKDGRIRQRSIEGVYLADVRIVSLLTVAVGDTAWEHIATVPRGADTVNLVRLLRHLDDDGADPRVRMTQRRSVSISGMTETFRIESTLPTPVTTTVIVLLGADLASMETVKSGRETASVPIRVDGASASWGAGSVSASLSAPDATLRLRVDTLEMSWDVSVPPKGSVTVGWSVDCADTASVVSGVAVDVPWSKPVVHSSDERLTHWVARSLDDLDALRLSTLQEPDRQFLAAGAPWFFTLFGRDSIWAARFLLPLGTEAAADTLNVLARLQGVSSVAETAEQPGKIMHELRREAFSLGGGVTLPPLYYGTVDATPLWVCLLHDAWRWGMPDREVRALLPNLQSALAWMRYFGDADGDGLLEYVDETGHGLANQGWKDSGDSVQWKSGELAQGPIALCEVQGYAFEAAIHGADLLEHFGVGDPAEWREWAGALRTRFHEQFWVSDERGRYPAIALDKDKRPIDTITSNMGHLLGTGLLDSVQAALVATRLVAPDLNSGFGLRTMSTNSAGYWPLSYHGGAVWAHDTAIAIGGLVREGHYGEAGELISGLLAAASAFEYRMPELYSGDPVTAFSRPVPYPASCRPQAWAAAASVAVLGASLGLAPSDGSLKASPGALGRPIAVDGLRFGGRAVSVHEDGQVS